MVHPFIKPRRVIAVTYAGAGSLTQLLGILLFPGDFEMTCSSGTLPVWSWVFQHFLHTALRHFLSHAFLESTGQLKWTDFLPFALLPVTWLFGVSFVTDHRGYFSLRFQMKISLCFFCLELPKTWWERCCNVRRYFWQTQGEETKTHEGHFKTLILCKLKQLLIQWEFWSQKTDCLAWEMSW